MYEVVIGRSESDLKNYGLKGTIFLGKLYVKMGQTTSLSNKVYMDVARSHVILISGKRGCLTGDTKILTNNGSKQIKDINFLKDKIYSYNSINGCFELKPTRLIKYKIDEELFKIELENKQSLTLTEEHPILTLNNKKFVWKEANLLRKNDKIIITTKNKLLNSKIKDISKSNGIKEVYDLVIPQTHNFVANGIISHNSGKSYSMGVIAEEMCNLPEEVSKKLAVLIIDTMGIFWTMKYPNEKDEDLLEKWGLPKKSLDIDLYVPTGFFKKYKEQKIPADYEFSIKPSELTTSDWCNTFGIPITDPIGVLIERIIVKAKSLYEEDYTIENLIEIINEDKKTEDKIKIAAENRFEATKAWGIFSSKSTPLKDIIKGGKATVLDISAYSDVSGNWSIKGLVLGLICKKLMQERMMARKISEVEDVEAGHSYFIYGKEEKEEAPLVWILIDECLPYNSLVETNKGKLKIGDLIKRFDSGENIKVKGYDKEKDIYDFYEIKKTFKIEPRNLIKLKTETGRILKCTDNHPVLTKDGFINASLTDSLAFPLTTEYNQNKNLVLARIIGHIIGDGYLSKNKNVGFCGKGNDDLNLIKKDLEILNIKSSKIYERITTSEITDFKGKKNKVIGISQEMIVGRKAFKLFKELGLPIGKKSEQAFLVPKIIVNGSKEEKAEFLATLMGADGCGLTNANNSKADFNAIRFSFNKLKELESGGWDYANQITKLFGDLGIKVASIKKTDANIKKDGRKTIKFLITLKKDIENTIKFIEIIGFKYNSKKEINSKKWLSYLRYYREKLKEYNKLRNKAIELHETNGIGKTKISRILGIENYRVREWIYYNRKARIGKELESFEEFTQKRCGGNVLHEKIKKIETLPSEQLYDIEVDQVHNFIADETIVHNCHEFLPRTGSTPATDALVQILREGRQPGVSLIMATQQPGEIHKDVITQTDIVLSHRITARRDVEALNSMMQGYLTGDIQKFLNMLPKDKGSAVILDDNSERMYPIAVRPRFTWHGGEAPSAVKVQGKALQELGIK